MKLSTSGIITACAGICGDDGHSGDGDSAYLAQVDIGEYPYTYNALAIDHSGNLYFAEVNYHDVRKIGSPRASLPMQGLAAANLTGENSRLNIYPNPAAAMLTVENLPVDGATYEITDMPGRTLQVGRLQAVTQTINIDTLSPGSYIISLYAENKMARAKVFVKE